MESSSLVVHSAEVINSLINKEGMSESLIFLNKKQGQMSDSLKKASNSLIHSFIMSDLSESLTVAHLI